MFRLKKGEVFEEAD